MIDFELSDELISIKQIDQFKPFTYFKIKGQGELFMLAGTNKEGFGFEVHHEQTVKEKGKWVMKETTFFFTNEEMQELFIHAYTYYNNSKQIERDLKIKQIIN
jgi:hypothetical protein